MPFTSTQSDSRPAKHLWTSKSSAEHVRSAPAGIFQSELRWMERRSKSIPPSATSTGVPRRLTSNSTRQANAIAFEPGGRNW